MASVSKKYELIFADIKNNSYKWWTGILYDTGDVITKWGRTNYDGQEKLFPGKGEKFLEKKLKEKQKKGYDFLQTIGSGKNASNKILSNTQLKEVAKSQIIKVSNPLLDSIIERLVQANVHNIISNTNITFDDTTGLFTTPLGIVTPSAINSARNLLVDIQQYIRNKDWVSDQMADRVNQYLRLVPQTTGMRLNIQNLFPDIDSVRKQGDILNSLEASYQALQTSSNQNKDDSSSNNKPEEVFKVDFELLENRTEERRIKDWFYKSKKSMHRYNHIDVRRIFKINIHTMSNQYNTRLGNDMEVFHGTSEANVLSILKSGLKVSPPSTAAIAGKMFGNGIYGSKTSSKSLGYSLNRWGQGGVGDSGWLFVCSFAMGKAYYPTSYGCNGNPRGYDSVYALPSKTGLYNDELIVYKNNQVNIAYLLECK